MIMNHQFNNSKREHLTKWEYKHQKKEFPMKFCVKCNLSVAATSKKLEEKRFIQNSKSKIQSMKKIRSRKSVKKNGKQYTSYILIWKKCCRHIYFYLFWKIIWGFSLDLFSEKIKNISYFWVFLIRRRGFTFNLILESWRST